MMMTADTGGGPRELMSIDMTVRLDSIAQVIKVDGYGRPAAVAHTVNKCVMTRRGRSSVLVAPGQMLIARQQGFETTFFVKQRRFNEYQQIALESVAELDAYGAIDDRLYGTEQPRRPGEQWSIDDDQLAAEFARLSRREITADDVDGKCTLLEGPVLGGEPCSVVRIVYRVQNGIPGIEQLPPGSTLKVAQMSAEHLKVIPFDETQPVRADETKLDVKIYFSGKLGSRPADGALTMQAEMRRQFMPLPATQTAVAP